MKIIRIFGITLVISAVTIFLLEIVGRYTVPKQYLTVFNDVDHRMKPFSDKDINEDGIRFKGNSKDLQNQKVILFLGDSFTFGYRLRYHETIPQQFEQLVNEGGKNKITSVNFGWISSAPILEERILKDLGEKYHPDTVFLLLDMTDIWDDNIYTQFLEGNFITRIGKYLPVTAMVIHKCIQTSPALYEKIYGVPINRFFHSAQPLDQSRPLFARTAQTLNEIADYTHHTLHANFVLVVLPRNYQYSDKEAPNATDRHEDSFRYQDLGPYVEEPFRYFEEFKNAAHFPVFLLLEDFKHSGVFPTTFDNDTHYNPAGAKFAAESIYKDCEKMDCLTHAPWDGK